MTRLRRLGSSIALCPRGADAYTPASVGRFIYVAALSMAVVVVPSCSRSPRATDRPGIPAHPFVQREQDPPADRRFTFETEVTPPGASIGDRQGLTLLLGSTHPTTLITQRIGPFRLGTPIESAMDVAVRDHAQVSAVLSESDEVCVSSGKAGSPPLLRYHPAAIHLFFPSSGENSELTFAFHGGHDVAAALTYGSTNPPRNFRPLPTLAQQGAAASAEVQHSFEHAFGRPDFVDREYENERETVTRWCTRRDLSCGAFEPKRPSLSLMRQVTEVIVRLSSGGITSLSAARDKADPGCTGASAAEQHLYARYLNYVSHSDIDAEGPPMLRVGMLPEPIRRLLRAEDGDFLFCWSKAASVICLFEAWPPPAPPDEIDEAEPYEKAVVFTRIPSGGYLRSADKEWSRIRQRYTRPRDIANATRPSARQGRRP